MANEKLKDGKISIGAYMFPDRKKPCLCIKKGNQITAYGYFKTIDVAVEFMDELGHLFGVVVEKEGAKDGK